MGRRIRRHSAPANRGAFLFSGAAGVLTALASVGGLGYAATGASQAVEKAKSVVHVQTVRTLHKSAAQDQYRKPKAKCRKGTHRVKGVCKRIKKARGVRFRRPPFTG